MMVWIEKQCGLVVIHLLLLVLTAYAQEQSPPTVLKPEHSGVSPRLSDLKPQSESNAYPPVTVEKISFPQLRYRLIERFGPLWFCDPNIYPVGNFRQEQAQAIMAFRNIRGDAPAFREIAKHLDLEIAADFSEDQKLLVYREYKKLRGAISLEQEGDKFRFGVSVREIPRQPTRTNGFRITGLIDLQGQIKLLDKTPVFLGCPICLARGTRIDTPVGQVAIERLEPGMMVWTLDSRKRRVAEPILIVTEVRVSVGHTIMHIWLNDGRELRVSPGHPTADGRDVTDLKQGARYDGGTVAFAEVEKYDYAETFDLLPAGDTGFYWANGILLGSTLR